MRTTIITILACLLSVVLHAQNFEGTIKWSFKTEITDPEMKAKMEAAQAKMSDPATRAKMKEMQAKMEDPEFKKMMSANPQMKAQMDAMMKMMESGDMNSMMPKSMEVRVKGTNTLMKMEGGIVGGMEVLYLGDKGTSYRIDRPSKSYSVLPSGTHDDHGAEVKVTKTSEKAKILNYNCTKYIVETTVNGKTVQQYLWTTTEIKNFDMKKIANRGRDGASFYFDKVEGVPLKMEMKMPEGNMTMEAIEIKKQSLADSDFVIPAGYKEVKMGH